MINVNVFRSIGQVGEMEFDEIGQRAYDTFGSTDCVYMEEKVFVCESVVLGIIPTSVIAFLNAKIYSAIR